MSGVNIKPLLPNLNTSFDVPFKKTLWTYLPLLALVVGLGILISQISTRQQVSTRASGGVTLSMASSSLTVKPGEEFVIDLIIDPKKSAPQAAYIALSYPLQLVELVDSEITHQRLVLDGNSNVRTLGQVRFRAKNGVGQASIQYTSETWVTDANNENLINRTIGVQINIAP